MWGTSHPLPMDPAKALHENQRCRELYQSLKVPSRAPDFRLRVGELPFIVPGDFIRAGSYFYDRSLNFTLQMQNASLALVNKKGRVLARHGSLTQKDQHYFMIYQNDQHLCMYEGESPYGNKGTMRSPYDVLLAPSDSMYLYHGCMPNATIRYAYGTV